MIKVYGAEICVDCRNFKAIQKNRGFEVEYIDMTENTKNMREFLAIRDNDPIFDEVKQKYLADSDFFKERSWGMSDDYHIAIDCGSTMVRVGTTIFGPRVY